MGHDSFPYILQATGALRRTPQKFPQRAPWGSPHFLVSSSRYVVKNHLLPQWYPGGRVTDFPQLPPFKGKGAVVLRWVGCSLIIRTEVTLRLLRNKWTCLVLLFPGGKCSLHWVSNMLFIPISLFVLFLFSKPWDTLPNESCSTISCAQYNIFFDQHRTYAGAFFPL